MLTGSVPMTLFSVFLFFTLYKIMPILNFFYILLKKNYGDHYIWSPQPLYRIKLVSQNLVYQHYMYTVIDAGEPCNVSLTAYRFARYQTFRTFSCH